MPVIVPNGYEEQWTEQAKDADELKELVNELSKEKRN